MFPLVFVATKSVCRDVGKSPAVFVVTDMVICNETSGLFQPIMWRKKWVFF